MILFAIRSIARHMRHRDRVVQTIVDLGTKVDASYVAGTLLCVRVGIPTGRVEYQKRNGTLFIERRKSDYICFTNPCSIYGHSHTL